MKLLCTHTAKSLDFILYLYESAHEKLLNTQIMISLKLFFKEVFKLFVISKKY